MALRPNLQRLASIVATIVAVAAPLSAQQYADDPTSTQAMVIVQDRDRQKAHPGEALKVQGLGDQENDFLSAMPSLSRGEFTPDQIDRDAAYESQLAMLEGGRRDVAYRTSSPTKLRSEPRTRPRPHWGRPAEPTSRRRVTIMIAMAGVAAVVIGFFLNRDW